MEKVVRNPLMTLIALVLAFYLPQSVRAAEWTVNPADYRYDMSLYFKLTFRSADMQADPSDYEVAAFVDNECRGISEIMTDVGDCMYMRIRSNSESGETVSFRLRDNRSGEVTDFEDISMAFEQGTVTGLPSAPFILEFTRYYDLSIRATEGGATDITCGRYAEGSEITVTATPDDRYRFAGWSDGVSGAVRTITVNGDLDLEATFEKYLFTITYTVDGDIFRQTDIEKGSPVTAETAPVKEGFIFTGWDGLPEIMPAEDLTVSASYEAALYLLTVYLDNEIYLQTSLPMGAPVEIPEPELPSGHVFNGWIEDVPGTMPPHDLVIHGKTDFISGIPDVVDNAGGHAVVYDLKGNLILRDMPIGEAYGLLPRGIYIINGVKTAL